MSVKKTADADAQKKAAALAALELVKPGMALGLGTGSTANHFIRALGEKVKAGLDVKGVPTSRATADLAKELGIPLTTLGEHPFLDLVVDGADEFDAELRLIKGGGGALLIEKIVATSAKQVVIITDASKRVKKLGAFPLPIEVVNMGVKATAWKLERAFRMFDMKPKFVIRMKDGQAFRTDMGNVIVDASCGEINDPDRLDFALNNIPGVVNNGLFIGIATKIIIATPKGIEEINRK
ncbi:MAG: ribose-5-phosphate isomerase RpiA [Phyllobacteriaceae bacterium]|jgi:ribose 5-phosphate isomerase A|nr:ribose-5-phosphate isomerase RpiA [Phyllobacteriaceae bacterium]